MLGHDVHRHLAQIQVGADAGRGRDAGRLADIADDRGRQLPGAHLICTQISAHIHEHLIDRIDMDILGSHILQIDLIDLLAVCHVKRHARLRDDIRERQHRILAERIIRIRFPAQIAKRGTPLTVPVDLLHLLDDFEKTGTAGNAILLQRRRDRQADRLLAAPLIRHHQICVERVKTAFHAFHRSIKRLQVDGHIALFPCHFSSSNEVPYELSMAHSHF